MRSRLSWSSLLKLMIFIPLALNNMGPSAATNSGNHRWLFGRITLSEAVKESKSFLCKEPQFRAYNLKDLMQNVHQNPGESAIQPVYIVLKRCDGHSGCCTSSDMSCLPVESAISYQEIEIEVWSLENNNRRQWIRVEQHDRFNLKMFSASVSNVTRKENWHKTKQRGGYLSNIELPWDWRWTPVSQEMNIDVIVPDIQHSYEFMESGHI